MATAGNASAGGESNGAGSNNVPQWKRDLIQRRRQQNKVLSSNGASVKLCSAVTGTITTSSTSMTVEGVDTGSVVTGCRQEQRDASSTRRTPTREEEKLAVNVVNNNEAGSVIVNNGGGTGGSGGAGVGVGGGTGTLPATPTSLIPIGGRGLAGGATGVHYGGGNSCEAVSVARNMRLEADLSLCSDSEDVANGGGGGGGGGSSGGASNRSTDMERKQEHNSGDESEDGGVHGTRRTTSNSVFEELRGTTGNGGGAGGSNVSGGSRTNEGDAESDSSEELQYGPGIVNKLKSKYLNLALRETNKSRTTVQRFRRAASLEDLLDREDEPANEKNNGTSVSGRKYAKRNVPGQTGKTGGDRYRNANRGNEMTMKRARSVETLVRYNNASSSSLSSIDDSSLTRMSLGARIAPRQDPVNDHIVLVDRSTVKIESRLSEIDRPKPANKPKRIKPVLAETERPPPDLVKTTMRIFEGSAKKLKPKGEVAAKVATFKTINDTFKAQNQKKILPKPPLQPKPFVNGNARTTSATSLSPKKIVLPQKPTAELIETDEEFHFDGVITDPIVQSVSSVVSKFQQIEKSHSPSPSPEPTFNKLRFSPAPSPEPQNRSKFGALEIGVKSPPLTPLLSPRIASPGVQSPSSPIKETIVPSFRNVSPIRKLSPVRDAPEMGKFVPTRPRQTMEKEATNSVSTRQRVPSPERNEVPESPGAKELPIEKAEVEEQEAEVENGDDQEDGPKTISSSALDNIGKAGTTMRFRFNDEPNVKNYLPGTPKQNGRKLEERPTVATKPNTNETKHNESSFGNLQDQEIASRLLRERLASEKEEKRKNDDNNGEVIDENKVAPTVESKPPKSASLISSTTTSYPQGNESKTIRCQKSESSPPQKQIGIIRPLVSTKTQHPQQNLSNRELEKNLINRVKSIEQPTKVVVSLKSADEIQPTKKSTSGSGGGVGGGGLWDGKPWNQQNNTMVFNFSNRKDVPDYIENDGYIVKRKREKPKVGDGGIIVLDATLDASTTDDGDSAWELLSPPSPCDVSFLNDNILINGRSNLSRTPRNHKHRIQFDDTATRTFEYPSEASMLEGEGNASTVDGETSASAEQSTQITNKTSTAGSTTSIPSLLGGGGLASYTPSKVDLASEGFELGVTRATSTSTSSSNTNGNDQQQQQRGQNASEVDYLKPAQDGGAWGSETTGDLLY